MKITKHAKIRCPKSKGKDALRGFSLQRFGCHSSSCIKKCKLLNFKRGYLALSKTNLNYGQIGSYFHLLFVENISKVESLLHPHLLQLFKKVLQFPHNLNAQMYQTFSNNVNHFIIA